MRLQALSCGSATAGAKQATKAQRHQVWLEYSREHISGPGPSSPPWQASQLHRKHRACPGLHTAISRTTPGELCCAAQLWGCWGHSSTLGGVAFYVPFLQRLVCMGSSKARGCALCFNKQQQRQSQSRVLGELRWMLSTHSKLQAVTQRPNVGQLPAQLPTGKLLSPIRKVKPLQGHSVGRAA